jgi:hypothetical protein
VVGKYSIFSDSTNERIYWFLIEKFTAKDATAKTNVAAKITVKELSEKKYSMISIVMEANKAAADFIVISVVECTHARIGGVNT